MSCLVIFNKQLGDTLLLQPALAKLAAHHGGPVRLITSPALDPLLQLMPDVEPARLTWKSYQALYCYDPGSRSLRQSFFSRARQKQVTAMSSTYVDWRHRFVFDTIAAERTCERYVAQYYWDHTPGVSGALFAPPRLLSAPAAWRHPGLPSIPYIIVNPASAWKIKSYPTENWRYILENLAKEGLGPFVLTGGPEHWHQEICRDLASALPSGLAVNLAGQTSLKQFIHMLGASSAILTADGSASHIGAAFRRPTYSIFGPTTPTMWHWPTDISACITAKKYSPAKEPATSIIPKEDALAAMRQFLANR